MGMPAMFYRLWYRAHGIRALEHGILRFVGLAPVRTTMIGGIGAASAAIRGRWLSRIRKLGAAAR
jgi:hypothetical protein